MRLKLLGLLLAFAGVLYWQDSTSDDAMDKYIADYKKFQAQADSATKFADSLVQEITIADNEARAAQGRANLYSRQATELKNETLNLMDRAQLLTETITDTLQLARQILPLKDSIITKQETTITTQDKQIQELEIAILKKDDALKLALLRGDSLQTVVNNIPPAPKNPNRMFGIRLPSRKTSFIVGVVAGVVVGGVVLK
jgi:hypothetical protein